MKYSIGPCQYVHFEGICDIGPIKQVGPQWPTQVVTVVHLSKIRRGQHIGYGMRGYIFLNHGLVQKKNGKGDLTIQVL